MCKIVGIGVDICTVARIEKAMERERFGQRVYTEEERAYLAQKGAGRAQSAAAMYAAKEAVAKALGTGFARGVMPDKIGVTHDESGRPGIALTGAAAEVLRKIGGERVHISLTHENGQAMAFAVIEGSEGTR